MDERMSPSPTMEVVCSNIPWRMVPALSQGRHQAVQVCSSRYIYTHPAR